MGSACTKSEAQASTIFPRLIVGHDYQEVEGQFIGEGVKKTVAWKATLTEDQLREKREEFWRTRTTGRRQVWLALKEAAQTDHQSASLLLQMAEIFTEKDSMTVCFDTNGIRYELPPFVINDPVTYYNAQVPKKPKPTVREETIEVIPTQIKMRLMPEQHDSTLQIANTSTVNKLKEEYRLLKGTETGEMRFFFGGKELKGEGTLVEYGVKAEYVIQVFVRK